MSHLCCILYIATAAVSGQQCTDTVGSLSHDRNSNIVIMGQTYILAGYTVPCSGTVVAWEFCYRLSDATSVTFYPGIWRITGASGDDTDYELIQSNNVTYDSSIQTDSSNHINSCQRVNLSTADQFIAPAESVVGLYSNVRTQLLYTTDSSVTTYQFGQNQISVTITDDNSGNNHNIAIRVHLGKASYIQYTAAICNHEYS